jgi:hypothetical protein
LLPETYLAHLCSPKWKAKIKKLEGVMAEIIQKIDPDQYKKHTVYKRGKPVIDVILLKALYSTNKTINNKQCTIAWHVDDLKISYVDTHVVTTILNLLDAKYGQETVGGERAALTVTCRKIHDYLSMTLNYSDPGVVKSDMTDYVDKVLKDAPSYMDGTAKTPADKNLFEVRDNIVALPTDDAEFFHAMVAKLLFLCKRGRPDIQTAIAFLCTRVQTPTKAQSHH